MILPLALELGGIEGGRWGLGKYAKSQLGKARAARAKVGFGNARQAFASDYSDFDILAGRKAAGAAYVQGAKGAMKTRKGLTSLSKNFLYSGLGIIGFALGKAITGASRSFATSTDEIMKSRYRGYYSGADEYFDSRAAMTQRQRALQVIHNSQMSTRASFGNESSYMHY